MGSEMGSEIGCDGTSETLPPPTYGTSWVGSERGSEMGSEIGSEMGSEMGSENVCCIMPI